MLAYVFWHWPQAGVAASTYEDRLRDFHSTLAARKPPGFLQSVVYRVKGADWLPSLDTYEEWYLTEGSAALDPLNEAAVAPACRAAHDAAAQLAAGGTAGLYRLRLGSAEPETARFASWLAKPAGMSYEDFYARIRPLANQRSVALWGRQMVLGPTPEFCLHSAARLELPSPLHAQEMALARLWVYSDY